MANNGEYAAGGVTRVTQLPTPVAGLRGEIFYLSAANNGYDAGLWRIKEDELKWAALGGGGIGQIYISQVTPLSGKNVSNEITEADNNVWTQFRTDHQVIVVHVRAMPGPSGYKPSATVNGVTVSNFALEGGGPEWNGSAQITLPLVPLYPDLGTIIVEHGDGAKTTCDYELKLAPEVQLANFTGGYPSNPDNSSVTQTELNSDDTYQVYVETNVPMSHIQVQNHGASTTTQLISIGGAPSTTGTFSFGIGDRGNTPSIQGLRIRARDADGSFGDPFTIVPGGNDGNDQLTLNDVTPSLNFSNPTYPGSQQAIKNNEAATLTLTASNHDTVISPVFSSGNGDLDVSPGVLNSPFSVPRVGGGYNVSTNNITATVYRSTNGRKRTISTRVNIAHDDPTITVSTPWNRLRSGGNHGTPVQNHNITISSNQQLLQAPSLAADSGGSRGTFGGTWSGSPTSYTRPLQVSDDDEKGTFSFEGLAVTNLAGKTSYVLSGNLTYVLGGFVRRTLSVAGAFANTTDIGTQVTSFGLANNKMSCFHFGKNLPFAYSSTDTDSTNEYTIDDGAPYDIWRCLDGAFNTSNATGYTIELEESV